MGDLDTAMLILELRSRVETLESQVATACAELALHRQFGDAHLHRHEDLVHEHALNALVEDHVNQLEERLAARRPEPAPREPEAPATTTPTPAPPPQPKPRDPAPEREPHRQHALHRRVGGRN